MTATPSCLTRLQTYCGLRSEGAADGSAKVLEYAGHQPQSAFLILTAAEQVRTGLRVLSFLYHTFDDRGGQSFILTALRRVVISSHKPIRLRQAANLVLLPRLSPRRLRGTNIFKRNTRRELSSMPRISWSLPLQLPAPFSS